MKYPELQNFCAEGKRWMWKPEDELCHTGKKGMRWRKHKYLGIKNGIYDYGDNSTNQSKEFKKYAEDIYERKKRGIVKGNPHGTRPNKYHFKKKASSLEDNDKSFLEKGMDILNKNESLDNLMSKQNISKLESEGKLDWLSNDPDVQNAYKERNKTDIGGQKDLPENKKLQTERERREAAAKDAYNLYLKQAMLRAKSK